MGQSRTYRQSEGSTGEPNREEMCGAIHDKFAAINQNLRQTKQLCEQRAFRNDPFLAMQCFGQYGASGGTGNLSAHITRCDKVACEKGVNQVGYICEYILGFSMPSPSMSNSLNSIKHHGQW